MLPEAPESWRTCVRLKQIGQALQGTLRQIGNNWWTLALANLVAVILSLPLLLGVVFVATATHSIAVPTGILVLVLGVLPNPMAAGMQFLAFELAHREGIFLSEQWAGLRTFGPLALRLWALSLTGSAIILGNVAIYTHWTGPVAIALRFIWLYVLLIWVSMHLYVYPLLMEQQVKSTFLVYRNAFVIAMSRPVFTTVMGCIWLLILVLTSGTALAALLGLALAACLQQNAAAVLVPTFEDRSP